MKMYTLLKTNFIILPRIVTQSINALAFVPRGVHILCLAKQIMPWTPPTYELPLLDDHKIWKLEQILLKIVFECKNKCAFIDYGFPSWPFIILLKTKQKVQYDAKHSKAKVFEKGDKVLMRDMQRKKRKGGKLGQKWVGPHYCWKIWKKVFTLWSQ